MRFSKSCHSGLKRSSLSIEPPCADYSAVIHCLSTRLSLPVPVGCLRRAVAEFVAQLARAFQLLGVNRRVAGCVGVILADGLAGGRALEGGLQVALGQPDARVDAIVARS